MIGVLVALGVPQRFAKAALIVLAVVLALVLLAVGKCSYDAAIINDHDDKRSATIAADGRKGEANAAVDRRADDAAISNQSEEVHNAVDSLPESTTSARQHARACVILRQQADANSARIPASTGC
ncbi:hypothetical protein [Sphingomonas sp. BAUL-RG-20F-R05-02]|uniref:hypothetical protein n=1 Tax=Sphingomonas sp. BAUL-RG-20F-R05-02 TaxID=2914830 RepID=UPI001F56AE90|nr:hypothetical protein [Sphingomonas sp. BAUL-RG-20F-R05-02]